MKRLIPLALLSLLLLAALPVATAQDGDTETYVGPEGPYEMDYPADWFAEAGSGDLVIANVENFGNLEEANPGEAGLTLLPLTAEDAVGLGLDLATVDISEAINTISAFFVETGDAIPEGLEGANYPAARLVARDVAPGGAPAPLDVAFYVVKASDELFMVVCGGTRPAKLTTASLRSIAS
ncbi:MAG: hypothetical protein HC915_15770 [Anaerolineae bacterium]|nr:hypothetical protein [Anaerolineae bacterium]